MSAFWNEKFAGLEYVYGQKPNEYIRTELSKIKPGKILFPAEGEGRNAVYAAREGWHVVAYDSSDVARNKAISLAEQFDVNLDYRLHSHFEFMEGESFDVIAFSFAHMPEEMRKYVHQTAINSLNPGGYVIMECFSVNQLGNSSGGPKTLDLLYTEELIRRDFQELDIEYISEETVTLDEGKFHQGKAVVIRFKGRKR